MNAERIKEDAGVQRVLQSKVKPEVVQMEDNRQSAVMQSNLTDAIQRAEEDEEELLQGKFETTQLAEESNQTGIPSEVKGKMEESFGTDFSGVRVHPESSKAPEVGALAYTQGTDIHFAPGQFKPDTASGQQLLGHELAHVIQQAEGRVQPTTEVNGMPVNDSDNLESEADALGQKAVAR